jgi:tetratricopeptide (TPR) repeat protein
MRIGKIFIGITLAALSGTAVLANPDSLFSEGNKAYTAGDFEKSVNNYNAVAAKGFESDELYLNLGNAYYKMRNYPKAILCYERALLIDPGNEKVQHNLAKAQMFTVDKINQIPEFLITGWLNHFIMIFRTNTWALISMITFVLSIIGFLGYFLSMSMLLKRSGYYSGTFFLVIALLSFYLSYKSKNIIISGNGAIVISPTITVKGEPNSSSSDLFIIHEGTKVYIMDVIDDWNEVKLADGKTGWLRKKDIEPI